MKIDTTGSLHLIGTDLKSVIWENNKLVVNSDLDINNNNLNVVDSDLSVVSCLNNNYIKWLTASSDFKVKGTSTIDGMLTLPTDNIEVSIIWDGAGKLLSTAEVEINSSPGRPGFGRSRPPGKGISLRKWWSVGELAPIYSYM